MSCERKRAALFAAVLLALGVLTLPKLEVGTEITEFLPDAGDRALAELSRHVARSELNRTLTLTIAAPDRDTAAAAATALGERLAEHPEVARVQSGPDASMQRAFYELYFPARFGLIPPGEQAAFFSDDNLRARGRELRERLASPTGTFVREIAVQDPWSLFLHHVEALRDEQTGTLGVHRGAFVTEPPEGSGERAAGVVFVTSRTTPFDGTASAALLAGLAEAFAAVDEAHDGALALEQASVHRIASMSETSIRADITRVSLVGTLGVVLLLLVLFASPRILALGILPLVAGTAAAAAVCQLVFGRVHGLTLAFGATLIGVAIDYVAHYFNHHVLDPSPRGPMGSMKRIWPGLALGAATTIAGLAGLAWTSFPGIRQMAVFTVVGVAVALLATRELLPPMMPASPTPTRLHAAIAKRARSLLATLRERRALVAALPVAALVVAVAGLPAVRFEDDIRALSEIDPAIAAEDARVRERVARMEAGRFVIATGDTIDEALARNDEVADALRAARADGLIDGARSLSALLPSPARQAQSRAAIPADAAERSSRAFEAEGFAAGALDPFAATLREGLEAPPLTWSSIAGTSLEPLASRFVVELDEGEGVAVLSFVTGLDAESVAVFRERVEAVEGARFFDQPTFMANAYREFRTRTTELVLIGLVLVFALIFMRYGKPRPSLAAFLPSLLAAGAALGVVALIGQPITLLHVITLLLVLSMGVDYGVFMVESGHGADADTEAEASATVVSLLTACASTTLSFGALALSAQPAMRAMGTTAALGVLFSLILAPSAWLLTQGAPSEPE